MDAICDDLEDGAELRHDTVSLTFDDAVRANYQNALPILERAGVPATVFVSVGIVRHRLARTKSQFLCEELLGTRELRDMLQRGVTFGLHIVNHGWFPAFTFREASEEIVRAKQWLEDQLGVSIRYCAYAGSQYDSEVRSVLRDTGFRAACTTAWGLNRRTTDAYEIRRLEVRGNDRPWQVAQKVRFGTGDGSIVFPLKYYAARVAVRRRESRST